MRKEGFVLLLLIVGSLFFVVQDVSAVECTASFAGGTCIVTDTCGDVCYDEFVSYNQVGGFCVCDCGWDESNSPSCELEESSCNDQCPSWQEEEYFDYNEFTCALLPPPQGTQTCHLGSLCQVSLGCSESLICVPYADRVSGEPVPEWAIIGELATSKYKEGAKLSRSCEDSLDNDCNGLVDCQDPGCAGLDRCNCIDEDGDGFSLTPTVDCDTQILDCDDNNITVYPGAPEICDGIDNQCSWDENGDDEDPSAYGQIDEGGVCDVICTDGDNDGFNAEGGSCGPVDCNDGDILINPGASEICGNAEDENCDGVYASDCCQITDVLVGQTGDLSQAFEGDTIPITIKGTNCDGLAIRMGIIESDDTCIGYFTPTGYPEGEVGGACVDLTDNARLSQSLFLSATPMAGGEVSFTWVAEWFADDTVPTGDEDPEFFFVAVDEDGISPIKLSNKLLKISQDIGGGGDEENPAYCTDLVGPTDCNAASETIEAMSIRKYMREERGLTTFLPAAGELIDPVGENDPSCNETLRTWNCEYSPTSGCDIAFTSDYTPDGCNGPGSSGVVTCQLDEEIVGDCSVDDFLSISWRPLTPGVPRCDAGSSLIECIDETQLPFFGLREMLVSLLFIAGIYGLVYSRKKRAA